MGDEAPVHIVAMPLAFSWEPSMMTTGRMCGKGLKDRVSQVHAYPACDSVACGDGAFTLIPVVNRGEVVLDWAPKVQRGEEALKKMARWG